MNECIFCKIISGEIPSRVLYDSEDLIVFMDNNPDDNGHMLVVPKKHYTDFTELDDNIILKINIITKQMKELIYDKLNADGIRLINNYGIYQIVKHYHLHIIPCFKEKQEIINIDEIFNKLTK